MANKPLQTGAVYRHYKNRYDYIITSLPVNPNTKKQIVVYRTYGDGEYYARYWRTYADFDKKFERVEK